MSNFFALVSKSRKAGERERERERETEEKK
jgi:hypothetical protein